MPHDARSPEMQQCIQSCSTSHAVCIDTAARCLRALGTNSAAAHVRLLLDCAQICHTSADFMLRGSELHGRTCALCAEVCERCAEACERLGADDESLMRCAEACRRCAESCRLMSMEGAAAA